MSETRAVLSMTGFGRARAAFRGRDLVVEVHSVNHRSLQVRTRLPEEALSIEKRLRDRVAAAIARGSVTVSVHLGDFPPGASAGRIREEVLSLYARRLAALRRRLGIAGEIPLEALLALPGVIAPPAAPDVASLGRAADRALAAALAVHAKARAAEGRALAKDLARRMASLERGARRIEQGLPAAREHARARLRARLEELAGKAAFSEKDVLREAALAAERSDVAEEVVRIASHLAQARAKLSHGGRVGRALEFLAQELQRETNTLASKLQDPALVRVALDAKEEAERIREQVANLE